MGKGNGNGCSNGILFVVGTGPGSLEYMTPAVRTAIEKSDIVIGYQRYLEQVQNLIEDKEVMSSSMMQEVDRVQAAIRKAEEGQTVALISGGDPGIYGMAGLVYDIAAEKKSRVVIQVVAGIPALNSCAERLGAPLMHDFCSISLSDLLTPWELIENRVEAAASADFVIVIYNPKSKKRRWQLARTCKIIEQYRKRDTPVGIVKAATREQEEVTITTLEQLQFAHVDMQSTVIVGNSMSYVWRGKMITPRGYLKKYAI